jgi:calcyphosin
MDDDQSGSLTQVEFFKACKDFKVGISEENVPTLFSSFDKNGDGTIDYEEFLIEVRGEMNQRRSDLVKQAHQFLADRTGAELQVENCKDLYDAKRHPDVIQGKRTLDNVMVEFIETFEAHHNLGGGDRNVSLNEWLDYWTSVSATIESDDQFELIIKNTFGMRDHIANEQRQTEEDAA